MIVFKAYVLMYSAFLAIGGVFRKVISVRLNTKLLGMHHHVQSEKRGLLAAVITVVKGEKAKVRNQANES